MASPDLEGALDYALTRLERELPASLVYHSIIHTRDEVAPAVECLALHAGVEGADRLLLRTAAYFHDLGFVVQRYEHEAASAQIATAVLPRFGYGRLQVERITGMIRATRLPQTPTNLLEELLADADLDLLGRDNFLARNDDLRRELSAHGPPISDQEWFGSQMLFLSTHRYWTAVARTMRDRGKARNLALLNGLVAGIAR
jgi:uncharacterized protein